MLPLEAELNANRLIPQTITPANPKIGKLPIGLDERVEDELRRKRALEIAKRTMQENEPTSGAITTKQDTKPQNRIAVANLGGGPQEPINPQAANDAAGMALMMRNMNYEQRERAYPTVRSHLGKMDQRMASLFPQDRAPTDGELDDLLLPSVQESARRHLVSNPLLGAKYLEGKSLGSNTSPHAGMTSEELQDLYAEGKFPEYVKANELQKETLENTDLPKFVKANWKPRAEGEVMPLTPSVKREIQQRITDSESEVATIDSIYKNFDEKAFTHMGRFTQDIAQQMDKFGMATKSQQELLAGRVQQRQQIERLMLLWRKHVTGVAGGDKEMARIENTTLNMNLSPAEARSALDLLTTRVLRDRQANYNLLQQGISPETLSTEKYTERFNAERENVNADFEDYSKRFMKVNKGATPLDAWRFRMRKQQLAPQ